MRWLAVLPVLCVVGPASAQENDAEKLYRAMENKVRTAKTLQVAFDGEFDAQVIKATMKGMLYATKGNKTRVEGDLEIGGKTQKMLTITDGKVKYSKLIGEGKVDPNPRDIDQLDAMAPGMLARVGMVGQFVFVKLADPNKKPEPFDLDKEVPIKNFKLGAKEMVGNRSAQVVEYQVDVMGKTAQASVWIDTQTQLPLKRLVILQEKGQTGRISESYETFTVNATLDPKLFDIPK
jgi:hypothetical protein